MAQAVKQKNNKNYGRVILVFLIALALAATGYLGVRYNNARKEIQRLSNPQEASKAQATRLTAEVGKLIELPSGELPTVATVTDASKLKNQTFFARAENGDKVLIFSQAKKAILYRPAANKIIEVAPLSIGNASQPGL